MPIIQCWSLWEDGDPGWNKELWDQTLCSAPNTGHKEGRGGSWASSGRKWNGQDSLSLTRMTVTDGGHLWLILQQLIMINRDCRAQSSLQPTEKWVLTETDWYVRLSLRKCDRQAKKWQHRDKNSQSDLGLHPGSATLHLYNLSEPWFSLL